MSKLNNLNRYQKIIISLLLLMSLIFTAVYLMNTSKVGYKYRDTVLVHNIENDVTIY